MNQHRKLTNWKEGEMSKMDVLSRLADMFLPADSKEGHDIGGEKNEKKHPMLTEFRNAKKLKGSGDIQPPVHGFGSPRDVEIQSLYFSAAVRSGLDNDLKQNARLLPAPIQLNAHNSFRAVDMSDAAGVVSQESVTDSERPPTNASIVGNLILLKTAASRLSSSQTTHAYVSNDVESLPSSATPSDNGRSENLGSPAKFFPTKQDRVFIEKDEITDNDILCGRGFKNSSHPGNERLFRLILENARAYDDFGGSHGKKTRLSTSIVREVTRRNGRFLADVKTRYYLLTQKEARQKVSTALRDALPLALIKQEKVARDTPVSSGSDPPTAVARITPPASPCPDRTHPFRSLIKDARDAPALLPIENQAAEVVPPVATKKKKKAVFSSSSTAPIQIEAEDITERDVLCGREFAVSDHPGNVLYRQMIENNKARHHAFGNQHGEKTAIRNAIVHALVDRGGRFVRKTNEGEYHLLTLNEARSKTSQSLRENKNRKKLRKAQRKAPSSSVDTTLVMPRNIQNNSIDTSNEVGSIAPPTSGSDPSLAAEEKFHGAKATAMIDQQEEASQWNEDDTSVLGCLANACDRFLSRICIRGTETESQNEAIPPRKLHACANLEHMPSHYALETNTTESIASRPTLVVFGDKATEVHRAGNVHFGYGRGGAALCNSNGPPPASRSESPVIFSPLNGKTVRIQTEDITDDDILCGREFARSDHPGNRLYLRMIENNKARHHSFENQRGEKTAIRNGIVQEVVDWGGRFIRKTNEGEYHLLTLEEARTKTSQALRTRTTVRIE